MTSIRKFLSRAALGTFVASLFFASTSHAQVRQTSLYIDDGSGHFNILQADPTPKLGGTYLFPSTGGTNMIITTANLSDITGGTSFTPGGVFYGITASTMGTTVAGTSGNVLVSGGAGAPTWAAQTGIVNTLSGDVTGASNNNTINTASAPTGNNIVTAIGQGTGVIGVANGGTGAATVGTGNEVFASPNGTSGAPGFRPLVDADLPSDLGTEYIQNQNAGPQTTSNFNISGTGTAATGFVAPLFHGADAADSIVTTVRGNNNSVAAGSGGSLTIIGGQPGTGGKGGQVNIVGGPGILTDTGNVNIYGGGINFYPSTAAGQPNDNVNVQQGNLSVQKGNIGVAAGNITVGGGNASMANSGLITGKNVTISTFTTAGVVLNSSSGVLSSTAGPLPLANGGTAANNTSIPNHEVFIGPISSGPGNAGFRPLDATDIPDLSGNYIDNQSSPAQTANFNISGNGTISGILDATGSIQNTTSNPLLISTVNGELTTIGNPTGTTTMPGTVNATGSIQNTTSNPLLISTVNGELTTIGNPTGTTTMPGTVNATGSIQNTTSNPLLISTVNGELTTIGNPTGTTTMPGTVNATGSIQNTTSNPLLISTVNGELTTIGNPTGTTTMPGTVNATGSIQNTTSNPLLISTVNGETTTIGNPTGTTTMPGIVNATGSIENTTSNPLLISTANGETTKIGNPTGTTTMPGIVNATGSIENTTVAGTLDISTASGEATTIGNLTGTTTIQGPGVDLPGLATAAPLNGILGLNGSNQVVISNAAIVEGSGTQNTLPKWNNAGGTTLGDSKLTDDGTDLVYNTAFDVSSSGAVSGVTTLEASTSVQDDALSTAGIVTNTGAGLLGTVAEVPVANGGTGAALSLATGDLITASSSTAFTNLADVATGSVLVSGGVGTTPKWSTLGNIAVTSITGTANEINPVALSTGAVTLSLPSTLVAPGTFEATTSIKDDGLTAAGIVTNTAGGALGTETLVPLANGGTDADLSGQGGAHEVLEQFTNGGAVTVGQLANTDITGLGTMSTQDADAVDITGGTIDGTVIGGTSPAAGSFTTLNASTSETFTNLSTAGIVTNTAGGVLGTETLGTVAVTSAAGTANEVLVDGTSGTAETGAVTLSLPSTLVAPGTFEATTSIKDDGLTAGVVTSDGSGNLGSETLVPLANGGTGQDNTAIASNHLVFAGPVSSAPGTASFRLLDATDIPDLSGNYIDNQSSPAQTANFNISGSGTIGGTLNVNDIEDGVSLTINTGAGKNTTIGNSTGSTVIATNTWGVDVTGNGTFAGLASTGNSTIATNGSTTNTFGNGGNANNSIGDGGSAKNSFGSVGGSITNSFGDGASAINTFGTGASATNTIGSTVTSSTTILGGTTVGINNSGHGPTSIGNASGGVTIQGTNWGVNDATGTATLGGSSQAGSLVITDGTTNTYALQAATGGSFSPTFLLPTEAGPGPYTLATADQIPNGTNYIKNQDAGEQVGANFDIAGSGTLGGTLTVNGGFIEGANPLDIQDEAGALNLGNNSSPITMEGPVDIDYTTTFAVSSGNDITGTAGWNVDNAGNANFVSIGTGTPGTGAFSTLAVGSTGQLTVGAAGDLSTSGTIATTGASGITSAGPLKASGTLVYSTEGPFDATSNAVAVTGTTVFAEVNGTPTGTVTLTVTNGSPVTGQVLLIYNSTTEPLELNSQYVFPSYTGKFIYYGSQWILMQN